MAMVSGRYGSLLGGSMVSSWGRALGSPHREVGAGPAPQSRWGRRRLDRRQHALPGILFQKLELAGGGFQVLPYDPDFEKTMNLAGEIMDEYRDTLAALAK